MAFRPGKDAFILLDGVAGTPINVSGYADNFSFPQPVDTIETSVFGTVAKQFVPGLTDGGQVSMGGPLDVALGTMLAGLKAAQSAGSSTCTLSYSPAGSVAGQLKVNAECWLGSYEFNTAVGGRADYSSSLQITGVVAVTTW